jgi:heterodisulfide reductase subunit A
LEEKAQTDARIGVFICDCGSNIAGYLDMKQLVEYAKTLPNVVFVQENLYTCSEGGINEIKAAIPSQGLNRVVVASCTPRTHEPLFQSGCEEAGLNPYLFEMGNIRDQCSWVHQKRKRGHGTRESADRHGRGRLARLKEPAGYSLIFHRAVVIGGLSGSGPAASATWGMRLTRGKRARLGGFQRPQHGHAAPWRRLGWWTTLSGASKSSARRSILVGG